MPLSTLLVTKVLSRRLDWSVSVFAWVQRAPVLVVRPVTVEPSPLTVEPRLVTVDCRPVTPLMASFSWVPVTPLSLLTAPERSPLPTPASRPSTLATFGANEETIGAELTASPSCVPVMPLRLLRAPERSPVLTPSRRSSRVLTSTFNEATLLSRLAKVEAPPEPDSPLAPGLPCGPVEPWEPSPPCAPVAPWAPVVPATLQLSLRSPRLQ